MARGEEEPKRVIPPSAFESEGAENAAPGVDDQGTKEAAQLNSGKPIRDLKREADENEHDRSQKFKSHFEGLALCMLYALFIGFGVLAAVWFFHLIFPTEMAFWLHGWLTKDQLDKLGGVLTGGIIAGLIADHFKRRIG